MYDEESIMQETSGTSLACIKMTYALDLRGVKIIVRKQAEHSENENEATIRKRMYTYLSFLLVVFVNLRLPSYDAVLLDPIALFEIVLVRTRDAISFAVSAISIDSLESIELLRWRTRWRRVLWWHGHRSLPTHACRHVPTSDRLLWQQMRLSEELLALPCGLTCISRCIHRPQCLQTPRYKVSIWFRTTEEGLFDKLLRWDFTLKHHPE
jgi:hypothetical protein